MRAFVLACQDFLDDWRVRVVLCTGWWTSWPILLFIWKSCLSCPAASVRYLSMSQLVTFQERSVLLYSYDEDMDEDEDINSSSLDLDGETNANGDESIIRKYLRAN